MSTDVVLYEGGLPALAREAQETLKKKTPKAAIYERPGPFSKPLAYVPWAWVAQQLNVAFGPAWSLRFIADPQRTTSTTDPNSEEVLVMMELTTPLGSQQAFGSPKYKLNNPNASYGDALQSAASKALRRAASRWGIGLDLYLGGEEDEILVEDTEAFEKLYNGKEKT